MITRTLREALVEDLRSINGTDDFSTDVRTVAYQPRHGVRIKHPAAFIFPGLGGLEFDEATPRTGMATQNWDVLLQVREGAPHEAIEDFLDDVRHAVERTTSNLCGVDGVVRVSVVSWGDEERSSEDVEQWRGEITCTVEVVYHYDRNSV